jgi:hypothetical protein
MTAVRCIKRLRRSRMSKWATAQPSTATQPLLVSPQGILHSWCQFSTIPHYTPFIIIYGLYCTVWWLAQQTPVNKQLVEQTTLFRASTAAEIVSHQFIGIPSICRKHSTSVQRLRQPQWYQEHTRYKAELTIAEAMFYQYTSTDCPALMNESRQMAIRTS